jgi:UDP-N-acetyl-D-mannosaminuronic acid transferase (WecB/TagA/CpsF family)
VAKYGSVFVATRDLALRLGDLLQPGETFFEWGSEPGLYAITGQRPISGVLNMRFSLSDGGSLQQQLTERILSDLQQSPPDLVIVEQVALGRTPKEHPVYRWIAANYQTFEQFEMFHLAARRGSDLARRQR